MAFRPRSDMPVPTFVRNRDEVLEIAEANPIAQGPSKGKLQVGLLGKATDGEGAQGRARSWRRERTDSPSASGSSTGCPLGR